MARAKARYVSDRSGELVPDFPDELRQSLRKLLRDDRVRELRPDWHDPDEIARYLAFQESFGEKDPLGDPRDPVVGALLAAAYDSKVEMRRSRTQTLKKGDLAAEHADLIVTLRTARDKLRSVSAELDLLLEPEPLPRNVADQIDSMLNTVERAAPRVRGAAGRRRAVVQQRKIAVRLCLNVIAVFQDNGLPVAASAAADAFGRDSLLIAVLKLLGDGCGLVLAPETWRATVRTALTTNARADANR